MRRRAVDWQQVDFYTPLGVHQLIIATIAAA
jgi:hypothetical protein